VGDEVFQVEGWTDRQADRNDEAFCESAYKIRQYAS